MGSIIIDGNSIGHANHNGTKLSVGELQTQAIFGVLKSVRGFIEMYPGWKPIVLWDGDSKWRKEIYPEYKANRKPKDEKSLLHKEAYKTQVPFIRKGLQLLGVRQLLANSYEADDLAGIFSKVLSSNENPAVVITGDKDWLQMVNENVSWFDPIRDRKVGLGNFFESTGYFTTEQFLDGKALMGDTSDNISGVGGIGEKGAPEFIAEFKSVENFFKLVDDGKFIPKKKAHQNLASEEGRNAYRRNIKLMNLLSVPNPPKEDVVIFKQSYNREAFQVFCEKLAFASVLREFDTFLKPFEREL